MNKLNDNRTWLAVAGAVLLAGTFAWADSSPTAGNPETNAADRNYDTNQPNSAPGAVEKTRDAGDRGLNKVDNAVHSGVHHAKHGAHKAKRKTQKTYDEATEPATKP